MSDRAGAADTFNWLLSNFAETTSGVSDAIAVSADGILLAASQQLTRATAEQFAAITSGLISLANGGSRLLELDALEQIIVEMGKGFVFVTAIGLGAALGVIAAKDCDIGLVAYEMTLMVDRFGEVLTPDLLVELKNPIAA
jgi:uncharacterized protein